MDHSDEEDNDRLFAYGLLMPGMHSPVSRLLREHTEHLGSASIRGKLYDCGGYPGAVPSPDTGKVYGHLYRITGDRARLLAELDEFEGDEYERRYLTVETPTKSSCQALVYVYVADVTDKHLIECGSYEDYASGPKP